MAASLIVAAGAVAAGTGILEVGTGPTQEGSYTVRAITDEDGGVCLAINLSVPGRPDGRQATCDPRPLTQPLTANFGFVSRGERLVSGVVTDEVSEVLVEPGHQQPQLKAIDGAPGRYFDVVVSAVGPIRITASDERGQIVQEVDGRQVGTVGQGLPEGESRK